MDKQTTRAALTLKVLAGMALAVVVGAAACSGDAAMETAGSSGGSDTAHFVNSGGFAAVYGGNTSTSSAATGVFGDMGTVSSGSGAGVFGKSASPAGYGVFGNNTGLGNGGYFTSARGVSLYATGSGGEQVYGEYTSGSGTANGVKGASSSSSPISAGVFGNNTGSGYGVHGKTSSAASKAVPGVLGEGAWAGVEGYPTAPGGSGIYGTDNGEAGGFGGSFYGTTTTSTALQTSCTKKGCVAASFGGQVTVLGSGTYTGTWTVSSDERLKKDIAEVTNGLDEVLEFRPVTFRWKEPSKHGDLTGVQHGFIAQDVEKIHPGWVQTDRDGFKSVDVHGLHAMEVDAIRTLKTELDAVKAENTELRDQFGRYLRGENAASILPPRFNFNYLGWTAAGALGMYTYMNRKKRAGRA